MSYFRENGLFYELNNDNYTSIIKTCDQNIQTITIPQSIYYQSHNYIIIAIGPFSFAYHENIQNVEFACNSKIEIIDKEAFTHSNLTRISIPPSLTKIGEKAFFLCEQLSEVEIPHDSKLEIIEDSAFMCCIFDSFYIPQFVTKIGNNSFDSCLNLTYFSISENSQLTTIGNEAFGWAPIRYLYFPENLNEFGDNWCLAMPDLCQIEISPKNKNFKFIDEEHSMIVKKSDPNTDLYDVLFFVARNVESILIPNFIKHINSSAISGCEDLSIVQFESDSQLLSIGERALSHSSFHEIVIPASVIRIEESAFARCEKLQKVDFEEGSKLQYIGKHAFSFTLLFDLTFPEELKEFGDEWSFFMSNVCNIKVSPKNKYLSYFDSKIIICKSNENDDNYDTIVFARRDIEEVRIPSFIKCIKSCAFFDCNFLQKIEFSEDSQLESIESYAFSGSLIQNFIVPKSVKYIGKSAFFRCNFLDSIKFHEDSELIKIGFNTLDFQSLNSFTIPQNVEVIEGGFNSSSRHLKHIYISPKNKNFELYNENMIICKSDPKIDSFDSLIFVNDDFDHVIIPSFIKYIKDFTFKFVESLKTVEFEENSQLVSLGFSSFAFTSIQNIVIPASVKTLERMVFHFCLLLSSIEFLGEDVEIDSSCFCRCDMIKLISFPYAQKVSIAYDAFQNQQCYLYVCSGAELCKFPSRIE